MSSKDLEISGFAVPKRSTGLWRQKELEVFLGATAYIMDTDDIPPPNVNACVGWGRKESGRRAEHMARRHGLRALLLEDGFLRSFGLGVNGAKPLSLVIDDVGIYYDATAPSRLENLLNAGDFSRQELQQAQAALDTLRREKLSKYNCGLSVPEGFFPDDEERVLVVDQTAGDASIRYGLARTKTFEDMLACARRENPGATIYVKTHPDVLAGRKQGCLPPREMKGVRWIAGDWHPHSLLEYFDKVYVVTSMMGLDALIMGKEVHCFGMPFYAGWGLTHDRQQCPRRTAKRTLTELIAAAYLQYAVYINPETGERGTFFDVARFIARQKRMVQFWEKCDGAPWSGRVFAFGFSLWKHAQVRPFFGDGARVHFVRTVRQARREGVSPSDRLAVWGMRDPEGLAELERELGLKAVRVEDGFLRSVGLGADFVPPKSLVFDDMGIYFDPSRPSRLERLLAETEFSPELLKRAARLREFIVRHNLTKYNLAGENAPTPRITPRPGQKVILVPGQVEDDASILLGAGEVRTNTALLQKVRKENPQAYIIYKPHPDVMAGNRKGGALAQARELADHVELHADIIACIEACDELHTMTSLSGFDALLRGKKVVTYGAPFYAGWGLTQDHAPMARRRRELPLDALAAATLILYPRYWGTFGFVSVEHSATLLSNEKREKIARHQPILHWHKWIWGITGMLDSLKLRF